jgi:hypothetical protein
MSELRSGQKIAATLKNEQKKAKRGSKKVGNQINTHEEETEFSDSLAPYSIKTLTTAREPLTQAQSIGVRPSFKTE